MRLRKVVARGATALAISVAVVLLGTYAAPKNPAPRPAAAATIPSVLVPDPTISDVNPTPDGGRARPPGDSGEATTIWDLRAGTVVLNPVSGRHEVMDPEVADSAVLIGDSQSSGAAGVEGSKTWVQSALAGRGYRVQFKGAPGTGYVAHTPYASNYADAVAGERVLLPYGNAALVVVEGGGNDAAQGATDAEVLANAERLFRDLKASYPHSEFVLIGTLTWDHRTGDKRVQLNELMAEFAHRNGIAFISPEGWLSQYGLGNKLADGVHLNPSGHKILSQVLSGKLAELKVGLP